MATFSEFLATLTIDQVNDWWDNIAPEQAPEKDESQNWKYWISRNGKSLPFKYVIRQIAEHNNTPLENFGSNDNTRNQFSSKYNFEIEEELVFDIGEKKRFVDFYKNKVKEGENFHIFLDYVSDVVEKTGIKPYNVRMAINKMSEVLVIISMRNVLSYSEQEGKSILGFIIPKTDLKRFKDDVNEHKTYPYKGGDDKVFLEIQINDWKDVPPDMLTSNLAEIKEYYAKEKSSKFIRWNSEAKTSNSVLKYLIFKRISADDFLLENGVSTPPLGFFTKKTFDVLHNSDNKRYDKNNVTDKETYNYLKEEYKKVDHWAKIVQKKLFPNGDTDIFQKPTNQGNKFDGYLWAKVYPTKADAKNKRLAITVGLSRGQFDVKIDTVGIIDDQNPIRKKYIEYRGEPISSAIVKRTDLSNEKVKNWDDLMEFSIESINNIIPHYGILKDLLFPNNPPPMKQSLNKILYGPPGTGKTYKLQNDYFKNYTLENVSETKEQFLLRLINDLTWWEVIALAIYELKSTKVPELSNHQYVKIKNSLSSNKKVNTMLWGSLQAHTIDDCQFVKFAKRISPQIFTKTGDSVWSIVEETLSEAPQIAELSAEISKFNPQTTIIRKNYSMVTFHQNFSYEDFIEGIKPVMSSDEASLMIDDSPLTYEIQKGIFHRACISAVQLAGYSSIEECMEDSKENRKSKLEASKPYAIFIDEINRANVSSVFGELITLIEDDKRLGAKNEITDILLPYSKTRFAVPMNLHIVGTMNTADRSVESLDTALRRRFAFEEMMPDSSLLTKTIERISLAELLNVINERVEILIDRDHTIGHSYLIAVNDIPELSSAFKNKIIPLLQEYFFGDYGKIGLVLGEGFVSISSPKKASFANFKYDGQDEFTSAKYQLIPITDDFDIIKALNLLLSKGSK